MRVRNQEMYNIIKQLTTNPGLDGVSSSQLVGGSIGKLLSENSL